MVLVLVVVTAGWVRWALRSSPRPAFCSVGEITSGSDRVSGDCVGGRRRSGGGRS